MDEEFLNKWKSQVKKGTLSFILLNLLRDGKYYGYELIEQIKKTTYIEIAEGTLYPLMKRLYDENLVSSQWVEQTSGIPRKYYMLTPKGEQALKEMKIFWDGLGESIKKLY